MNAYHMNWGVDMKENYTVFTLVKRRLDIILSGLLLFILISPQVLWDSMFGRFRFDHVFFGVVTLWLVLMCVANWTAKKKNRFKVSGGDIWLGLYAAVLVVSVVVSTNPPLSLHLLPRCLSGLFIVYIIGMGELTYAQIRRIFGFVTIGIMIAAIYAFVQSVQGIAPSKSYTDLSVNPNMPGRVYSFFGNPNIFGFMLASSLPAAIAYAIKSKSRWCIALGMIAFILGCLALIMTYSRGAWFGFAVGLFVFAALYQPKFIPVMLLLGAVAFPFIPANIKDRVLTIFNPNDTSIGYRSLLTGSGVQLIMERPIWGVGLGLDTVKVFVLEHYWPPELVYRFSHTHNLPVQIWCETGVFGFLIFFGAVFHNIICAIRIVRKESRSNRVFIASLVAGMTGMLFCGIADYPFSFSRAMMLFWIWFGLLNYVRKREKEELHSNTSDAE